MVSFSVLSVAVSVATFVWFGIAIVLFAWAAAADLEWQEGAQRHGLLRERLFRPRRNLAAWLWNLVIDVSRAIRAQQHVAPEPMLEGMRVRLVRRQRLAVGWLFGGLLLIPVVGAATLAVQVLWEGIGLLSLLAVAPLVFALMGLGARLAFRAWRYGRPDSPRR